MTTRDDILEQLRVIEDPEIPALNVVDMGIVRDVQIDDLGIRVVITPTYSGCPAMRLIEERILSLLDGKGYGDVSVQTTLAETWTTDWMSDDVKRKLTQYGIAPPLCGAGSGAAPPASVGCPFCESEDTELRTEFGSTACKALYYCNGCRQPFEHFKSI